MGAVPSHPMGAEQFTESGAHRVYDDNQQSAPKFFCDDATALRVAQSNDDAKSDRGGNMGETHRALLPPILEWLRSLGRNPNEKDTCKRVQGTSQLPKITFEGADKMPDLDRVAGWGLSPVHWAELMGAAKVYHGKQWNLETLIPWSETPWMRLKSLTADDMKAAQETVVTGPVHILYDVDGKQRRQLKRPVTLASVSGINVAFDGVDVARFVRWVEFNEQGRRTARNRPLPGTLNENPLHNPQATAHAPLRHGATGQPITVHQLVDDDNPADPRDGWWVARDAVGDCIHSLGPSPEPHRTVATPDFPFELDEETVLEQIRRTWWVTLRAFQQHRTEFPVLSAIGCGAFRGPFLQIPSLWARGLAEVLGALRGIAESDPTRPYFKCVLVAFPHFPQDVYNQACFEAYFQPVNDWCVTIARERSMVHLADVLVNHPELSRSHMSAPSQLPRVGMLNPSDVYAVRQGHMGMFFDGDDKINSIALEEVLAVGTTVLTQNRYINRELWTKSNRWVEVEDVPGQWPEVPAAPATVVDWRVPFGRGAWRTGRLIGIHKHAIVQPHEPEAGRIGAIYDDSGALLANYDQDPGLKQFIHQRTKLCPGCGKPNAVTLPRCNGCSKDLARVEETVTDNTFAGFIYGVDQLTLRPGLAVNGRISIRQESESFLCFDDTLQMSGVCHLNCIPTYVRIPDIRYLLLNPTEGISIIKVMRDTCRTAMMNHFPGVTIQDCAIGFNLPPSQYQLHLQCIALPLTPVRYQEFLDGTHFTEGRFYPYHYVKSLLEFQTGSSRPTDNKLPTDDELTERWKEAMRDLEHAQNASRRRLSYKDAWNETMRRYKTRHLQRAKWTPDRFAAHVLYEKRCVFHDSNEQQKQEDALKGLPMLKEILPLTKPSVDLKSDKDKLSSIRDNKKSYYSYPAETVLPLFPLAPDHFHKR